MSASEQSPGKIDESSRPLTRRERKRQAKRNKMLDSAMAIIVEGGMEALTIARLARRLDSAVGALYRYFPGKQALLVALEHRSLEQFSETLQKDLEMARAFLTSQPNPSEQAEILLQILVAAYSYIYDAKRAPTRHRLMDILIATPTLIFKGQEAYEVEATLFQLLSQVAQLFADAVNHNALQESSLQWHAPPAFPIVSAEDTPLATPAKEDSTPPSQPATAPASLLPTQSAMETLPVSAWQRTYVLWSHIHGLDHFRKRDRLLPAAFQVSVLFRTGLCGLLQGWGASESHLQEAFDLFEAFLPTWTQEAQ